MLDQSPTFGDPRLPARFWTKVRILENGCWEWVGAKDGKGYGQLRVDGRNRPSHRLAYEALVGLIPAGLEPDHLCRRPSCVIPLHLEPVTHAENLRRADWPNSRKSSCPYGHPLSGDNLIRHGPSGGRACRKCRNRRNQEYKRRLIARRPHHLCRVCRSPFPALGKRVYCSEKCSWTFWNHARR